MSLPNDRLLDLAQARLLSMSTRAFDKGIDFDLDLDDVLRLLGSKHCHYTGMRLSLAGAHRPNKLTIDRIDHRKGYTKENTVACSLAANQIKNLLFESGSSSMRMTANQLESFARSISDMHAPPVDRSQPNKQMRKAS